MTNLVPDHLFPFSEMEDMLLEEGYEAKPPSPTGVGQEIDGEISATTKCSKCGREGMGYAPFSKPGSYRAFMICPQCGYWEEF